MRLNEDEKSTIVALMKHGFKSEDVALTIGCSKSTIDKYIRKIRAKEEKEIVKHRCRYCNKEFFTVYRRHYCSQYCMEKSLRKCKWSKDAVARYYTDKLNEVQSTLGYL